MKYLKKFESFVDNFSDTADPDYHKNHHLGNKIVDSLSEKDIYLIRKPDSWEEVEDDAVDFEDLPSETLKMLFELPLYKVNDIDDLNQIFSLDKTDFAGADDWLLQAKKDLESGNIKSTNLIFYESLNVEHQYFLIQFKFNEVDCGLFVDTQGFNYMRYVLMIKSFSDLYDYYKKEIRLREQFDYVDSLFLLNESTTSEKLNQIWSKVVDRCKGLPDSVKRKIVKYTIASMLALGSVSTISNIIKSYQTEDVVIKDAVDESFSQFKDATQLRVSAEGKQHIKEHEGLELVAYDLKDGRITIGYGHAEPSNKSKYRVGQKINKEQAEKLFQNDLKVAADGVRRIFAEWKNKGIERKITQDQFDALVSMALNQGVSSLRQSEVIQHLKRGDYKIAGEKIRTQATSDRYPGLKSRREVESDLFLSYLDDESPSTKL